MTETKLSKLPFALFQCLPTFGIWAIIMVGALNVNLLQSLLVALIIYCNDIRLQLDHDMLEDRILELERDHTDLKADSQKHDMIINTNLINGNLE